MKVMTNPLDSAIFTIIHQPVNQWISYAGVNPKNPDHEEYLSRLCVDFETSLKQQIHSGIAQRSEEVSRDPVYSEVIQHSQFCRAKARNFHGREYLVDVSYQVPFRSFAFYSSSHHASSIT